MTKICSKCFIEQDIQSFYKQDGSSNGYMSQCKKCTDARNREYQRLNRDKIAVYQKEYRKQWNIENRAYRTQHKRNRRLYDLNYRILDNLRARLTQAIYNNNKSGSAINDLGCSIDELKVYLSSKFQPGMTWDNWGRNGWHIDHIIPLSSFDLTDPEQFKKACHYTNLQPLWAIDNLKKGANINS